MAVLRRTLIFAAVVVLASEATAQNESPRDAAARKTAGDMNLEQFLAKQSERIMAADTDGDGKVSRAEMSAATSGGRDPSRLFDRLDANHDGALDAGEIRAAMTQRFHRLDANGDGVVTAQERMAVRERLKAMRGKADPAPPKP